MNITPSSRNNQHLIQFNVAPYAFCAPAAEVESIIMLPPVSRLPLAPPSVIGLINHRGQVYRVISLRRKLGLETGPPRMEGQLILTHLPAGLTAFLVDDVVDVLPDTNLPRRPLSVHSAMDLFNAFILRDEQVLFHTTFDLIDQARETDYPNPDLKTMDRMAAEALVPTIAPDPSATAVESTAIDEGETNGAVAPEKNRGRDTPPPERAFSKNRVTVPKPGTTPSRVGLADTPAPYAAAPPAPPDPARAKPVPQRQQSSAPPLRTRRYALALTGVLLLILIVALSSGLLVKQRLVVSQSHKTGAQVAPRPDIVLQNEDPELSPEIRRPPPLAKDAPGESLPPSPNDTSPTPPAPQRKKIVSPAPPVEEESPPLQTIANKETPVASEETSASSREILRMETETFTLMVERPSIDPQNPSTSSPNQAPPASATIVHRVIPGDTLWDIAEHYLGDPFQYPALAHLSQIPNPDLIYPGDIIRITKRAP